MYCCKNYSVIKDFIFWSHLVLRGLRWVLISSSRTSSWGLRQCQPKLWKVFPWSSVDISGLQHTVLTCQWVCWDQDRYKKENTVLQFLHTVFLKIRAITVEGIRELFSIACCKLLSRPSLNILGSVKPQTLPVQWRGLKSTFPSFSLTC